MDFDRPHANKNLTRNKCVLYLVFFQLLDVDPQDAAEEEGANVDLDSQRKGKCAVIKTSTRQVISLLSCITHVA